MPILSSFSQDIKNVIYYYVRQIKMSKMHLQKVTSPPLPVFFFTIAQPKDRILLLNFACVLFLCLLIKYLHFLDNLKILGFIGKHVCKIKSLSFWGQNKKY